MTYMDWSDSHSENAKFKQELTSFDCRDSWSIFLVTLSRNYRRDPPAGLWPEASRARVFHLSQLVLYDSYAILLYGSGMLQLNQHGMVGLRDMPSPGYG